MKVAAWVAVGEVRDATSQHQVVEAAVEGVEKPQPALQQAQESAPGKSHGSISGVDSGVAAGVDSGVASGVAVGSSQIKPSYGSYQQSAKTLARTIKIPANKIRKIDNLNKVVFCIN